MRRGRMDPIRRSNIEIHWSSLEQDLILMAGDVGSARRQEEEDKVEDIHTCVCGTRRPRDMYRPGGGRI